MSEENQNKKENNKDNLGEPKKGLNKFAKMALIGTSGLLMIVFVTWVLLS